MTRRSLSRSRGMTLIELMVAVGVMAMVAVLIHGVIDSLSRGRKVEGMRAERAHEGREALQRMVRDLCGAFLQWPPRADSDALKIVYLGTTSGG